VAVTFFAAVIDTLQVVPDDVVHPVQLFRIQSGAGVAVSVTLAPFGSIALHPSGVAALHAIPPPSTLPLPFTVTPSAYVLGSSLAVTVFADVIWTVHSAPDMMLHPVQYLNTELVSGLAVSTTVSPFANVPLHGTPDTTMQVNPLGANTVPPPPPLELTVRG
jgi:hypothetical protein